MDTETDYLAMTADIVSAYVTRNHISPSELASVINSVHAALRGTNIAVVEEPAALIPAVPIRKAVQQEAITCLHCGKTFKSLRRHIENEHGQSPAEYRATWGLPKDSPMVAPAYAHARSLLAKAMGLGQGGRKIALEAAPADSAASPPGDHTLPPAEPKRRGRPAKA